MSDVDENYEPDEMELRFSALCKDLQLSEAKSNIAWRGFDAVRRQCLMEAEPLEWLACSVYAACWLCPNMSPTPCRQALPLDIIRRFEIPLIRFLFVLRKWVDMANMNARCQITIMRMENSFAVCAALYSHFDGMFSVFFQEDNEESYAPKTRSKKFRSSRPAILELDQLKHLCWALFVTVRKLISGIADVITCSYDLMLCMFETMIYTVALSDRKAMLSSDFHTLVENQNVLEELCDGYKASLFDVKFVRTEWWRPRLKTLKEEEVLSFNDTTFTGFVDRDCVVDNIDSVDHYYIKLLMKRGDLDERLFLNEELRKRLLTLKPKPGKTDDDKLKEIAVVSEAVKNEWINLDDEVDRARLKEQTKQRGGAEEIEEKKANVEVAVAAKENETKASKEKNENDNEGNFSSSDDDEDEFVNSVNEAKMECLFAPATPLTCRFHYKSSDEQLTDLLDGFSQSTNKDVIIKSTEIDFQVSIKDALRVMFSQVAPNPLNFVYGILNRMGELYVVEVVKPLLDRNGNPVPGTQCNLKSAQLHRKYIDCLFMRLLAKLVRFERARCPLIELTESIVQEEFVRSLYGNCVEVVHFNFNPTKLFPWAMETIVKLGAFHYFKMLEMVVKIEADLNRETVKHFNMIEECILEELAWVNGSVFWVYKENFTVPSALEINVGTLRITSAYGPKRGPVTLFSTKTGQVARFTVTADNRLNQDVCRRLDLDNVSQCIRLNTTQSTVGQDNVIKINSISIPRNKVLAKGTPRAPTSRSVGTVLSLPRLVALPKLSDAALSSGRSLSSATRSIMTLFIKKFYHMAAVRLNHLCNHLNTPETLKLQTWALIERIVMKRTRVLKSRHVDQIILCCLYATAKMMRHELLFKEILEQYRTQPQARSDVYRMVLLEPYPDSDDDLFGDAPEKSSTCNETFDDIIAFYNTVFIPMVEDDLTAMFSPEKEGGAPSSPIPSARTTGSFRKAVTRGIFLSPMKESGGSKSPSRPIYYSTQTSPVKDLKVINTVVETTADRINERSLSAHTGCYPSCRRALNFGTSRNVQNTAGANNQAQQQPLSASLSLLPPIPSQQQAHAAFKRNISQMLGSDKT